MRNKSVCLSLLFRCDLVPFGVAGELGDDEGERGHGERDEGGSRARVVPRAGAADQRDGGAVRERDLRRRAAAPAVVVRRAGGAGRRRGAPDHPARAEEHQHVHRRRPRARLLPREAGDAETTPRRALAEYEAARRPVVAAQVLHARRLGRLKQGLGMGSAGDGEGFDARTATEEEISQLRQSSMPYFSGAPTTE